jgi:tRNA nucleotidyltransferase (CCA-adding enzyme)
MLCGENISYILRRYKDIVAVFLPEIVATFDFEQNTPHHNKTVWKHTTTAVEYIEADLVLRMTMLLHDTGKPITLTTDKNGVDHFKGHNRFSAIYASTALERLKYPQKFIDEVVTLIEYHDIRLSDNKSQIKHILNKIGEPLFGKLLKVQEADIMAQSKYKREAKLYNLQLAQKAFEEIIANNECYTLKDLKVSGSDLIHLGITDGKRIGKILGILLDYVIDGTAENSPVLLKNLALQINSRI